MHPAPSVILFTALSGLGFGMLVFLGLGVPAVTGWVAFFMFGIAFALAVGGLSASAFHLGNPKNALKAFSQWRSSWLSREACASVAALVLCGLYAIGAVFLGERWAVLGWLGAVMSIVTVFTTSMIYTQLKTVPRWNQPLTPALFLTLSLGGGALLAGQVRMAMALLVVAGAVQLATWWRGDKRFGEAGSTLSTATGLGTIGTPRLFEPPHTGTNFLLKEMVYVVGRKHSRKLRIYSFALMVIVPVLVLLISQSHFAGAIAVLAHLAGVLGARWLFFAEAEHVVGLYYGKR